MDMTEEEIKDLEYIKSILVFEKSVNERGWVVLKTTYNCRWLESILMGNDKHNEYTQRLSMDQAALTIWMRERVRCSLCEKFQDLNVCGPDLCKCVYCNHEFTVWLEDDN